MKLFGLHILKQETLDELVTDAYKKAIVIPNKMISRLLWRMYGKTRKPLEQAQQEAQMALNEKVHSG